MGPKNTTDLHIIISNPSKQIALELNIFSTFYVVLLTSYINLFHFVISSAPSGEAPGRLSGPQRLPLALPGPPLAVAATEPPEAVSRIRNSVDSLIDFIYYVFFWKVMMKTFVLVEGYLFSKNVESLDPGPTRAVVARPRGAATRAPGTLAQVAVGSPCLKNCLDKIRITLIILVVLGCSIYICSPPPWTTFCVFYSWESTDNNFHTSPDTKQQNKTKKHNVKFTLVHEGQEGQQMNSDIKRRKSY